MKITDFVLGGVSTYILAGMWMTYRWEKVSSSKGLSIWYKLASWILATIGWPYGANVLFKNFADLPPYAAIPPDALILAKPKKEEEKIDDADIPAQRIVRSTAQATTRR